jgi:pimeloyl-ACP methyl ester carboxylesterase
LLRKMMVLAAVVAVVLAAAAPALAESGSANNSGKLVDIGGGREMYMECQGTGYPTVVFVSGGGDRTETWSKTLDPSEQAVLPAIAETNRVCAYDRPGTIVATGEGIEDFEKSRSDPVPQPRTLQDGVSDLHALLSASGERGPYVVVGHSLGGAIAKLYASEYPQDVSGLVLIDYLPYQARNSLTDKQWGYWKDPLLGSPPKEALALYPALERNANQQNFYQDSVAAPLKPMPFIVLSADKPYDLKSMVEAGQLPADIGGGVSAVEFGKLLFQAVVDARGYLVSQVPGAKHITDTDSDHYVHQEQPQLVIDSIREVVDAAALGGTTLGDTGGPPIVPAVTLAAGLALLISSLAVVRRVLR